MISMVTHLSLLKHGFVFVFFQTRQLNSPKHLSLQVSKSWSVYDKSFLYLLVAEAIFIGSSSNTSAPGFKKIPLISKPTIQLTTDHNLEQNTLHLYSQT